MVLRGFEITLGCNAPLSCMRGCFYTPLTQCTHTAHKHTLTQPQDPPFDSGSFAAGVTYDATPKAGAAASCAPRVRDSWRRLMALGRSEAGRATLHSTLRLCE